MKLIIAILILSLSVSAHADILLMKDGTQIKGTIVGEMDSILNIKTKYGNLNIDKKDIFKITKDKQIKISTKKSPVKIKKLSPKYTFKTISESTSSIKKIYMKNGAPMATETFNDKEELIKIEGAIEDATYREYYSNGSIKTEKTIINGKESGSLKIYYPNGNLQSKAYYVNGKLNGTVKIFNENEKLLFEQNFKNSILNGFFKEYDEDGNVKSELFYINGNIVAKPKETKKLEKTVEAKKNKTNDSDINTLITVKIRKLARGERFSFYMNNKYIGKILLDNNYNILSQSGKIPDGTIQAYSKKGRLEKEFVFTDREITLLKVYIMGELKTQYTYKENQSIKK
ncbi:MAG: toxin-antitoxin system YwqK family antitoxin [Elusimicrobiales bacterium]|nr:toxin-antitoxin system YwqK family antitoxin [Elusimicrobiales bacterium]MCK5582475.1 toxin-antitoxin system YwqK family antitoxin [Elusimicrobiales bacterium]